jgi:hypothetical protein
VAVDLDEVRPHLAPAPQAREALAQVIQRDAEAHGLEHVDAGAQRLEVEDRARLGQLDHHAPRVQTDGDAVHQHDGVVVHHLGQGVGRDVDEQAPGQVELDEAARDHAHQHPLQRDQAVEARRQVEQHQRRMQRRVGRSARQRLVTQQGHRAQIDDGLEVNGEGLGAQQLIEVLAQIDGRCRKARLVAGFEAQWEGHAGILETECDDRVTCGGRAPLTFLLRGQ